MKKRAKVVSKSYKFTVIKTLGVALYFLTFEYNNGERECFSVDFEDFALLSEGDTGTLELTRPEKSLYDKLKNHPDWEFKKFERDLSMNDF